MSELEPTPLSKIPLKGIVKADLPDPKTVPQAQIDETERLVKQAQALLSQLTDEEVEKAIPIEKNRRDLKTIQSGKETPSENAKYVIGGVIVSLAGIVAWLVKGC